MARKLQLQKVESMDQISDILYFAKLSFRGMFESDAEMFEFLNLYRKKAQDARRKIPLWVRAGFTDQEFAGIACDFLGGKLSVSDVARMLKVLPVVAVRLFARKDYERWFQLHANGGTRSDQDGGRDG